MSESEFSLRGLNIFDYFLEKFDINQDSENSENTEDDEYIDYIKNIENIEDINDIEGFEKSIFLEIFDEIREYYGEKNIFSTKNENFKILFFKNNLFNGYFFEQKNENIIFFEDLENNILLVLEKQFKKNHLDPQNVTQQNTLKIIIKNNKFQFDKNNIIFQFIMEKLSSNLNFILFLNQIHEIVDIFLDESIDNFFQIIKSENQKVNVVNGNLNIKDCEIENYNLINIKTLKYNFLNFTTKIESCENLYLNNKQNSVNNFTNFYNERNVCCNANCIPIELKELDVEHISKFFPNLQNLYFKNFNYKYVYNKEIKFNIINLKNNFLI